MERLKTLLYNAVILLVDETYGQYSDSEEWLAMLLSNLGCSLAELKECGISIEIEGGAGKETISINMLP